VTKAEHRPGRSDAADRKGIGCRLPEREYQHSARCRIPADFNHRPDVTCPRKSVRYAMMVDEPAPAKLFRDRLHHGVVADEQDAECRITVEIAVWQRSERLATDVQSSASGGRMPARACFVVTPCSAITSPMARPSKLPKSHSARSGSVVRGMPELLAMISAGVTARMSGLLTTQSNATLCSRRAADFACETPSSLSGMSVRP
jgi:hypothetical protein